MVQYIRLLIEVRRGKDMGIAALQERYGQTMFIIAGLGNPGRKYENTRHNAGFMAIDEAAQRYHIAVSEKKHKALVGRGIIGGEKEIIDYYKIEEKTQLIVISDDISMEPGAVRIRKKGSAGGHNGLKNIILHLGHDEFQRIKIGVGEKPAGYDLADYVLEHFGEEEREVMAQSARSAAEAVEVMITDGPDTAMNRFNKKGRESI